MKGNGAHEEQHVAGGPLTTRTFDWSVLDTLRGHVLAGVRYHQLSTEAGHADWSLVPEFDSVDLGVELITRERETALLRWAMDDVTEDHALCAERSPIDVPELAVAVEVLATSRWNAIDGEPLREVVEARWARDRERDTAYPPALALRFENGQVIILAAAEYDLSRKRLVAGAEGITVFFSHEAATRAGIVFGA